MRCLPLVRFVLAFPFLLAVPALAQADPVESRSGGGETTAEREAGGPGAADDQSAQPQGTVVERRVVERDGALYLRETRRITEWEWTFPAFIGSLGIEVGTFPQLSDHNAFAGVYYRHLTSSPGPLFVGFEAMPFGLGAIYDSQRYPALFAYYGRALGVLRLYADCADPGLYFELAAGPQYVAFHTADGFATIYENGYPRNHFSRWRVAARFAVGLEFDRISLEVGWSGLFPTMEFDYAMSADSPLLPLDSTAVETATISGQLYIAVAIQLDPLE